MTSRFIFSGHFQKLFHLQKVSSPNACWWLHLPILASLTPMSVWSASTVFFIDFSWPSASLSWLSNPLAFEFTLTSCFSCSSNLLKWSEKINKDYKEWTLFRNRDILSFMQSISRILVDDLLSFLKLVELSILGSSHPYPPLPPDENINLKLFIIRSCIWR